MYFVTTVSEKHGNRCVGYFTEKETAIEVVKSNAGDINEAGYYPYAGIENIPEGLYQYDQDPIWFTYIEKTEEYKISPTPLFVRKNHFVGFGIG